MRIDKYLKTARILKRRETARQLAENDRIWLNGRLCKASSEVKIGDVIQIQFGNRMLKVEVADIQKQASKANAVLLFKVLEEERIEPSSKEPLQVVCAAAVADGKVLIARRAKGSSAGFYEFPGGKVEPGETKEEAVKREWMEEGSLPIEIVKELAISHDQQDGQDLEVTCFLATAKNQNFIAVDHDAIAWVEPDHIYDYNFFKSDACLVEALKKEWPTIQEQTKQKS